MKVFCLADNDITLKLAACDLFDDLLAALGITRSDVYVLATAKAKLGKVARNHPRPVQNRLNDCLAAVKVINWAPPPTEILLFEDTLGIDPGEAHLFAATAERENFLVATGDKVSLKALATSDACQPVASRLAGRVVCFELAVQICIEHFGFEPVRNKVVPARYCDTSLRSIFGSGLLAMEQNVADGLTSYINELRRLRIDLLLPWPPGS